MEAIASLISSFDNLSWWTIGSRALVGSAWTLALVQIWKARRAPLANQAFVAALAIVLGEILLIFHDHFSMDVLTFFVSMAQVVMAICMVKIFRWSGHLTRTEIMRVRAMEQHHISKEKCFKTYASSLATVLMAGVAYFTLVWIEQGHLF